MHVRKTIFSGEVMVWDFGGFFSCDILLICELQFLLRKLCVSKMLLCILHQCVPLCLQADSDRGCPSFRGVCMPPISMPQGSRNVMLTHPKAKADVEQLYLETCSAGPFLFQFCSLIPM